MYNSYPLMIIRLFKWYSGKEFTCQCRRRKRWWFDPWIGKIPWRREWQPTLVFLPGELHRQRNLVGHSPGGHKESDTTEHARVHADCRLSKSTLPPLRSQTSPQLQYQGDNSNCFHFLVGAHQERLGFSLPECFL